MAPYVVQDFYFKEARRLRYVARSAFKLLEVQTRHNVIRRGGRVLDLGCAPGAWLQVACQALGAPQHGGQVLGIDLKDCNVPTHHCDSRVQTMRADAFQIGSSTLRKLIPQGFNTVLCDMCPPTSGVDSTDVALSESLATRALELAVGFGRDGMAEEREGEREGEGEGEGDERDVEDGVLTGGGAFVVKLLEGAGTQEFAAQCKKRFKSVTWVRPKATRAVSREIYLVGKTKL